MFHDVSCYGLRLIILHITELLRYVDLLLVSDMEIFQSFLQIIFVFATFIISSSTSFYTPIICMFDCLILFHSLWSFPVCCLSVFPCIYHLNISYCNVFIFTDISFVALVLMLKLSSEIFPRDTVFFFFGISI